MRYISISEARRSLPKILETAQRSPVTIHRKREDVAVILSMEEYERLQAQDAALIQEFLYQIGRTPADVRVTRRKAVLAKPVPGNGTRVSKTKSRSAIAV